MYVCHGFMVEIYGFRHSLRTCLARAAHTMEMEVEDLEDKTRRQNESRCMGDS